MFSKVNSIGMQGFTAHAVDVECDLSAGLPRFDIVGLPGSAVSEARERVRSAIKNNKLDFPISRITVNLAPAEFRKEGPIYDLPILISILLASKQLRADVNDCIFFGELSLDGEVRRINGVLPMTLEAKKLGYKRIFLPLENAHEATIVPGMSVYPVRSIDELLKHLKGEQRLPEPETMNFEALREACPIPTEFPDLCHVYGQESAKRALEVAAAGSHNILFVGSPGSGKSMLAKCLPGILPDMLFEEALETTSVYSVAGMLTQKCPIIFEHPFRSPHHTTTSVAFTGGGRKATPGEISLANNGVLFLDELPLFSRLALETLREPLEDGIITVSRNACVATYPGKIMLVCAMNPCPCGYLFDPLKPCICSDVSKKHYLSRISGPLLDRIDIHVQVDPVDCELLIKDNGGASEGSECSAKVKERVNKARDIQRARFDGTGISCNANMPSNLVRNYCVLSQSAESLMLSAFKRLSFSARANDKILRTARTIADLDGSELIEARHVSEAIQYRSLDRLKGQL